MISFFDPASEYHLYPKGAQAAGTSLRLRVVFPRSFGVRYCDLVIEEDGSDRLVLPMTWEQTDGYEESWVIDYTPDHPAPLFYGFEYENAWGRTVLRHTEKDLRGEICGTVPWQLTVYSPDFRTPAHVKGGIIYQIFPDRFYNSGEPKRNVPSDRCLRNDFDGLPVWQPDKNGKIRNNDYFGGDFRGMTEKLGYLESLGVNIVYLNPICEAHSNHRYDTADYLRPDPLLGSAEDFREFCEECHKRGISVILDGVFSHTGDDSVYFNKYGRYGDSGAFSDPSSPYRKWYTFKKDGSYLCWWNITTLPEVNEEDPDFLRFITGENGVIDHWLSLGADGFRLDVADELPDLFIDEARKAVKRNGPEKYLLGEVWEDATNKISHGGRRRYLLGQQLDGVMNYPFRSTIIDFLLKGSAEDFMRDINTIVENYPPEAMNACMNHLGTHDTERILTVLSGIRCEGLSRARQASVTISPETLRHGIKLLKAAMCINYTLPGIPSVYYGDEAGMTGCKDPFNRACFPWGRENGEILAFAQELGRIRRSSDVLREGAFCPVSAVLGCIAYVRYQDGLPRLLTIVNKNPDGIEYRLPDDLKNMHCLIGGRKTEDGAGVLIDAETAVILSD